MDPTRTSILLHVLGALAAGGAVGLERSYHGRPAGFRTHALVCMASSLLMTVSVYEAEWFRGASGSVRLDPTRMAQGIVTGIGFLGAGVIFKEGLTVRGLTTAASIWITAAIGVLMGVGLYFPAALGTVLTLFVLTLFRRLEQLLPAQVYAQHVISFARGEVMAEDRLRDLLAEHGFKVNDLSRRLLEQGLVFEYRMVLRTSDARNLARLAEALARIPSVREYTLSPTGD
jgi:putative Mg2+ transporter-C (MgtC) family protein